MIQTKAKDPKEIKANVLKSLKKLDPNKLKMVVNKHFSNKNKGKAPQQTLAQTTSASKKPVVTTTGKKQLKLTQVSNKTPSKNNKPLKLAQVSSSSKTEVEQKLTEQAQTLDLFM